MAATCAVQQLIHQAKLTFSRSKGEKICSEELEKLKKIMLQLTAKDFNLSSDNLEKSWDFPPIVKDAPAAFLEVYECNQFSVTIFMLKARQAMPLHDHPHMFGLMKMLIGSMVVNSFNKLEITEGSRPPYVANFSRSVLLTKSSDLCCLHADKDNIHEIQAQDTPVAFLDILAPPYNPNEGRDCTFYSKVPPPNNSKELADERSLWLTPGKHPSWFSCVPQAYHGPKFQEQ